MRILSLLLVVIMILCAFVGCTTHEEPQNNSATPSTPKVDPDPDQGPDPDPDPDPVDDTIYMYYDDRVPVSELIGKKAEKIEIKDEVVTSKKANTDEADAAVLRYYTQGDRIIAAGTGTATLVVDGEEYSVVVSPAPITLVIITGHSIGYGSQGNTTESVLCDAGQVYNTTLTIKAEDWRNSLKGSTLGYISRDKVANSDALTSDAGDVKGTKGVASALAYEWNRLTGEKIWIVNCAVGGSALNQWQPGTDWFNFTVEAMNFASEVLKNEVAAGHYIYRTTSMINFSSANFDYQNVVYDDAALNLWHDGMWKGFVSYASVDIDGDGKNDGPKSIGYVPSFSQANPVFKTDAALIYYRAALKEHSKVFLASDLGRYMDTDENIAKHFPVLEYTMRNGESAKKLTKVVDVWADEGKATYSHFQQIAYNAIGFEIAQNLYNHVFRVQTLQAVELYDITNGGKAEAVGETLTMKAGEKHQFALVSIPGSVNNLDITVEGNLELSGPFYITATAKGSGTLIIKQGNTIVKKVTITIN